MKEHHVPAFGALGASSASSSLIIPRFFCAYDHLPGILPEEVTAMVDRTMLKVELVKRGWTQAQLAARLRVPPTSLSSWLNARHPAPSDLAEKIGKLLKVAPEILSVK